MTVVRRAALALLGLCAVLAPLAAGAAAAAAPPKPTIVIVKGVDKVKVGQFCAKIRKVYVAEPYKGKGVRYAGEVVRRKAGKSGK